MKTFSYLHLSGFAAAGLVVACIAQQWLGDHRVAGATEAYRPSAETIQAAEAAHQQAVERLAMLRQDREQEELERARMHEERQRRDAAWQAFYQVPAACQNPTTQILFTACADDHIRARKEFDREYKPGQAFPQAFRSAIATNEE
ncbi:MAG: hypothetical protein KGI91_14285 [Burkholderiales bacterium]|nr:hypothetical protein [Burkholderiales bacterium]MDE2078216.1 hypothetical protein [Burkholderiales bacterium]MDE2432657.1 hypothetical protein [Burkholderiales bacterium]HET8694139.1 hypothetical protein [Aquabacterium sp.]